MQKRKVSRGRKSFKKEKLPYLTYSADEIPRGIKTLIYYTFFLALFYLISVFISPIILFLGFAVEGTTAILINIVFFIGIVIMACGFIKRGRWVYDLAMFMYGFLILNAAVSLFTIKYIDNEVLSSMSGLIIATSIFALVMNTITMWYVYERRNYFIKAHELFYDVKDKVFISMVYVFYALAISSIVLFAYWFFHATTALVDKMIPQLNEKTISESISICAQRTGREKDVCFVTLVTLHREDSSLKSLCSQISSSWYRTTCLRAV